MKKFKRLLATLFLVGVVAFGVNITTQPAHACLATIYITDLTTGQTYQGFISCGSTAGNYVGFADGSSFTNDDVDFLCDEVGVC